MRSNSRKKRNSTLLIEKLIHTIRSRKWAILLIPLVGPLGELTESAINKNALQYTTMIIFYVGIATTVIVFSMLKENSDN